VGFNELLFGAEGGDKVVVLLVDRSSQAVFDSYSSIS
jgi:hypothetical protein